MIIMISKYYFMKNYVKMIFSIDKCLLFFFLETSLKKNKSQFNLDHKKKEKKCHQSS